MDKVWKTVPWPFSEDDFECHCTKIPYGYLYLWRKNDDDRYNFTVSCGASSDRSFTGLTSSRDLAVAKIQALEGERKRNA